ncbi:MAG: alpha/beta hydrolase family protein, partial [Thermoguttaceae bacterium]
GISWGGYLTSMLAGIDDRFQVVVPVYGCGNLAKNSIWKKGVFARMSPEQVEKWNRFFDPIQFVGRAKCHIFLVNGTDDFAYPLDIHRDTYERMAMENANVDVLLTPHMPHSHQSGWAPKEIANYVDSILNSGKPLGRIGKLSVTTDGDRIVATAPILPGIKPVAVQLCYSTDHGGYDEQNKWQVRNWSGISGTIDGDLIRCELPKDVRPKVVFLKIMDERGFERSTHCEFFE